MPIDCHIHSTISSDAASSVDEVCRAAVKKGFSTVCFTEHVDWNPTDTNYRFYDPGRYDAEIGRARASFGNKIEILQGIEFSEPHLYPREFEEASRRKYDFILASVHAFQGTWAGAADVSKKYSAEDIFEMHYAETLRMVQFGGFDSLAHMDFPRRYISDYREPAGLIDAILSELVRSNIALELNSSPLRKGMDFCLPSPAILGGYAQLGGKSVTVGSDAHHAEEIGSGNDHLAVQISSHQLEPVVFRGRKSYPVAPGTY
jgi:histidinol-phosphatase (PHP family)